MPISTVKKRMKEASSVMGDVIAGMKEPLLTTVERNSLYVSSGLERNASRNDVRDSIRAALYESGGEEENDLDEASLAYAELLTEREQCVEIVPGYKIQEREGLFWCYDCGKKYVSRTSATRHVRKSHSGGGEQAIACIRDGCPKTFTFEYEMHEHYWGVHLKWQPFVCMNEGCTFRSSYYVNSGKHLTRCRAGPGNA